MTVPASRRLRRPLQGAGAVGRFRRVAVAGLVALVAIVTIGCSSPSAGAAGASPVATTTVDLPKSYRFEPAAITVKAGDTVTWTNSDNFSHNVHFDGSDPQVMKPGETTQRTFDTAGTFAYVCSFHPQDMEGTVVVTGG